MPQPFLIIRRRLSHLRTSFIFLLALLTAGLLQTASAEEAKVTLNFVNADIESVTKAVSQITGKTFLIDPRVKGTVNVVSGKPVPQSLAYPFLLSALRMQGFAAVENNGVVRIVPEVDAKTQAGPTRKGAGGPAGGQMLTKIFPLRYESAAQMVLVLRPLIAPNNTINANLSNNSLVISDYADNLDRLEKIIAALDVPYGEEPELIPLRHASAIDMAATLNRLYGEGSGAGVPGSDNSQRVTLLADARSNGLIVRTDNPGKLANIRALINSLDQPTAAAGNIHVVYLKNAEAAKIAQTLRSIVTGETTAPTSSAPLSAGPAGPAGQPAVGMSPAPALAAPHAPSLSGAGGAGFIQADPTNNALIITAPEPVYNNLRRVIDMLDKRRAQVLVEALIVDLSSDRASELGIQWLAGGSGQGKSANVVGGTNFGTGGHNIAGVIQSIATAGKTGTLGLAPGLNLGILSGKAGLGVLVRALENDANANILSTPNLLTLDNEEARIVVGSNVPFVSGQYAQTGNSATATPFQTYDRKDVGLTLKIRPQISEGGTVRLQIYQEVSNVQENTLSNPAGPSTNKRSIETAVVVDDGSTIVIGGLIQDSFGTGEDKVPLLGDIPLLGSLFRYDTRKRTKTNLMVFLRPQIIRDAATYQSLTADRYNYVIGEQHKNAEGTRMMKNETEAPVLPPLATPPATPSAPAPQ
ncbi:MAG: type II secretion system secretin GspD [Betaproteobacteria bacterium]|nr:type II secretion system secretin GspD [Betaproteobacteria bacterium]